MEVREELQDLISVGKLRDAFRMFNQYLPINGKDSRNQIILLSGQLKNIEKDFNNGLVDIQEKETRKSKIALSLLSLLDDLKGGQKKSLLESAIEKLNISSEKESLGLFQIVNCDRRRPVKKFRRIFDRKADEKAKFQYYFLTGCPNQMPDSLAERIVYQIMEEEGVELNQAVHYRFREDIFRRMSVEKLPLGTSVNASKNKFKKYVQERFQFSNTQSFESFIETGVPNLPYTYVVAAFDIPEKEWRDDEGEISEYLQWMIDTFQIAHEDVPTFLFFFNIKMRDIHDEENRSKLQNRILSEMDSFCEKNDTALLGEITPITIDDFEDWADDLGVTNPNLTREVLTAFETTLTDEERKYHARTNKFHMKDIEPLQQQIVLTFRNKSK